MGDLLRDLEVLALDCQAAGATPAHGDLLELGWTISSAEGLISPVRSHWILPRTQRPVPRAVRELTGWAESCLSEAVDEAVAWAALAEQLGKGRYPEPGVPTVIHFARFELPFLRDVHQRHTASDFPFDVVCLHAVAARLLPDLPRRNIRALAGYFGHSPELLRRSAGHVEATAFIWRSLLPLLEARGVTSWGALKTFLDETALGARPSKRSFPLAVERRRALPDRPGVYRFVRRNGDILYVGKATSLKKRVAGHFKSRGPTTERALELLTQVHDVEYTETVTLLEAALLESDEIKRLEPPYNVQLRSANRSAWFASADLREAAPFPDSAHPVGPLPSERALTGLAALTALSEGVTEDLPLLKAQALAVPIAFLPGEALFAEGFAIFTGERLNLPGSGLRRTLAAARVLWLERGRREPEPESGDDAAPDSWDLARVRRRLERNLVQSGLLFRRARGLNLLVDATIAFREPGSSGGRALVLENGQLGERHALDDVASLARLSKRSPRGRNARQRSFDAATYDRLRVLLTELHRIRDGGGEVAVRVGEHQLGGEALAALLRSL